MAGYISSNENRFYVAAERTYGQADAITAAHRIPAVRLQATRRAEVPDRRDKTGSRTYFGTPAAVRCRSKYTLTTYMANWASGAAGPAYGPLFEAALGGSAEFSAAAMIAQSTGSAVSFSSDHGLRPGQAIAVGNEIRFVSAVRDSRNVVVNAPFAAAGTGIRTVTFRPATELASFSLFDYWSPESAVNRVLSGAGVDELRIQVNGDYQQFEFSGEAADMLDSASFETGQAGLEQFPAEPENSSFDSTIVPGHLGQVWMGSAPDQFLTLTAGEVKLQNNLDLRAREFGSSAARAISAGMRNVSVDFTVFAHDDNATRALHQAARQRSPIPLMFQLGEQLGQLCGVYLPNVVLESAEYDDSETRLQWRFRAGRAQGTVDDELFIAFA